MERPVRVLIADDGEEGSWRTSRSRARTPELAGSVSYVGIVLDVMVPDVDGFEVCRACAERRPRPVSRAGRRADQGPPSA
jgi:DNA-binding response OmpR family regulator